MRGLGLTGLWMLGEDIESWKDVILPVLHNVVQRISSIVQLDFDVFTFGIDVGLPKIPDIWSGYFHHPLFNFGLHSLSR